MLRRLLACLALLTGLTATGMPAHAQVVAELAAQVDASQADVTDQALPSAAVAGAYNRAVSPAKGATKTIRRPSVEVAAASVHVGIDRARE